METTIEPTINHEQQVETTNGTLANQPPQQLSAQAMSDLENELCPWTREFLKNNKTANDAISLDLEQKK